MPCVSATSGVSGAVVAVEFTLIQDLAHLSLPPCCQARRCRPKYETMIAASRNGTIAVAIAAPSPRLPPEIAALERERGHQVRRVERAAARQHVDQLEVGEREQHRERHHHGDDRRQQRQRDVAELLPRRRAVEAGGFVVRRRDRLQAREQRDRDERHAAPDVRGDRGEARVPRLAEEIDVRVDQAHVLQRPADDRELRIEDPPERDRGKRRGHDERQEHDGAEECLERQVLVEDQREPQPEHELDDARDERVEQAC